MYPFTPILLLILGALTMQVSISRSFRVSGLIALVTTLLAVVATFLLGMSLPDGVVLTYLQSESYIGDSLQLKIYGSSWLLAMALLLGLAGAGLAGLSSRNEQGGRNRAISLLVVSVAIVGVFADNLMTLAIAWAALDLVVYLWVVFSGGDSRGAGELSVNLLSVALVMVAAVVCAEAGVPAVARGGNLPAHGVLFLLLAAILRVGLYPVHVHSRRAVDVIQLEIESVTRLAKLSVAVALLAALVSQPGVLPLRGWLTVAALASGLIGGWRWYSSDVPQEQFTYMVMGHTGVMMLIFLWGGQWAAAGVVAQGVSVLLAGVVLSLYRGSIDSGSSWTHNPLLAALVLGGMPLTVGFVGVLSLFTGMLHAGIWVLALPIVVVIQALLMAGGFRLAFAPGPGPPTQAPIANAGYKLCLTIPVAAGVITGLSPDKFGTLAAVADFPGWSGMMTPAGITTIGSVLLSGSIGAGLWWFREQVRSREVSIPRLDLISTLDLRWLHDAVWVLYCGLARAMRSAALVLEGQGGVLWALVLATIVWMVIGV